ncbi:ferrous iron transport protein B [bacterium]|nr:ferrous iron transport protein B [bacterium]
MPERRHISIALAGNPNSGKTTIFNALTGARQKVGNWPGVTVEKKTGTIEHRGYSIDIIDLPGTYSLTAYSAEELVARSYIVDEKPDVVVHVVDSGNLARNLYLTTQLLELGVDVVLDLNMWDDFVESEAHLDIEKLHTMLGTPIVTTVGHRGSGIPELLDAAITLVEDTEEHHRHVPVSYGSHVDDLVTELTTVLEKHPEMLKGVPARWAAIKLIEGDEVVEALISGDDPVLENVRKLVARAVRHIRNATHSDAEKVITEGRHGYVEGALKMSLVESEEPVDRMELSRRIDGVFTHRFLGYPIFLAFVWLLFQATFQLGTYPMEWLDALVSNLSVFLSNALPPSLLTDLVVHGIVGGVGSVLIFLPNIMILFFGIAILEDSGYMARAAFLMDRLMHGLGLHGKSFIPLLMGFGCSVPAIMATRTLESRRDRILTTLLVPLMSCSAKLPVYVLIAGTFFAARAGTVVFAVYIIGVVIAVLIGRLFAKTIFRAAPEPFVMELPPYRLPTARGLFIHMWDRSRVYLQKMGGVILVASVLLWFLGTFPHAENLSRDYAAEVEQLMATGASETSAQVQMIEAERAAEELSLTYIGRAGRVLVPVIEPLGFTWEMGVSLVTGFVAKEVVVSTLGVLYHADGDAGESGRTLSEALTSPESGVTPRAAFAFMLFVLLYTPCIIAVMMLYKELGAGWMWFSIAYQTVLAWLVSFAAYQLAGLMGFA